MSEPLSALAATVALEQSAGGEVCNVVQADVPVNVCVRTVGHAGPHVAHDGDQLLQFAV